MTLREPNFDRVAKSYRTLEYLSMGRALERARFCFLPELREARHALVLGDGDGRFLSRLLEENDHVRVVAVDSSAAMLESLRERCAMYSDRVVTVQADGRSYVQEITTDLDLVATHFFLDCFSQQDVEAMTQQIAGKMVPGGLWVSSEFRISEGLAGLFSRVLVRMLYAAFHILAGLKTKRLPNHESALRACGMQRRQQILSWAGMLSSELWEKTQ